MSFAPTTLSEGGGSVDPLLTHKHFDLTTLNLVGFRSIFRGLQNVRITLYFIIPRTGSSTQLTENRTTLDLSFLISPDVSTNSIVKVFIKQRRY